MSLKRPLSLRSSEVSDTKGAEKRLKQLEEIAEKLSEDTENLRDAAWGWAVREQSQDLAEQEENDSTEDNEKEVIKCARDLFELAASPLRREVEESKSSSAQTFADNEPFKEELQRFVEMATRVTYSLPDLCLKEGFACQSGYSYFADWVSAIKQSTRDPDIVSQAENVLFHLVSGVEDFAVEVCQDKELFEALLCRREDEVYSLQPSNRVLLSALTQRRATSIEQQNCVRDVFDTSKFCVIESLLAHISSSETSVAKEACCCLHMICQNGENCEAVCSHLSLSGHISSMFHVIVIAGVVSCTEGKAWLHNHTEMKTMIGNFVGQLDIDAMEAEDDVAATIRQCYFGSLLYFDPAKFNDVASTGTLTQPSNVVENINDLAVASKLSESLEFVKQQVANLQDADMQVACTSATTLEQLLVSASDKGALLVCTESIGAVVQFLKETGGADGIDCNLALILSEIGQRRECVELECVQSRRNSIVECLFEMLADGNEEAFDPCMMAISSFASSSTEFCDTIFAKCEQGLLQEDPDDWESGYCKEVACKAICDMVDLPEVSQRISKSKPLINALISLVASYWSDTSFEAFDIALETLQRLCSNNHDACCMTVSRCVAALSEDAHSDGDMARYGFCQLLSDLCEDGEVCDWVGHTAGLIPCLLNKLREAQNSRDWESGAMDLMAGTIEVMASIPQLKEAINEADGQSAVIAYGNSFPYEGTKDTADAILEELRTPSSE